MSNLQGLLASLRTKIIHVAEILKESLFTAPMLKAVLVLTVLGYVPYTAMFGMIFLLGYGFVKVFITKGLKQTLTDTGEFIREKYKTGIEYYQKIKQYPQRLVGKRIGQIVAQLSASMIEKLKNNAFEVARGFLSFLTIFKFPSIAGWFTIYVIYRFNYAEWKQLLLTRASDIYEYIAGFVKGSTRHVSYKNKLFLLFVCALFWGLSFYHFGSIDIILTAYQLTSMAVGLWFFLKDFFYFLKNPKKAIEKFTEHPGKIFGLFWGRWLGKLLFPGKVIGDLGPAVGHIESNGFFRGLMGSVDGWFIFNTGLLGWLFSGIKAAFVEAFYVHHMRLYGNFQGVIGPTSFQMCLCMLLGVLLGVLIERGVDKLYRYLNDDVQKTWDDLKSRFSTKEPQKTDTKTSCEKAELSEHTASVPAPVPASAPETADSVESSVRIEDAEEQPATLVPQFAVYTQKEPKLKPPTEQDRALAQSSPWVWSSERRLVGM